MAAAISTSATTAEQQVFETLTRVRKIIAAYSAANPEADLQGLVISPQIDSVNNFATFTVTMPLTQSEDSDGGISFDATEVLVSA